MQKIKPIVRNWKKYRKNMPYKARFWYTKYYNTLSIEENTILFESFQGANFFGAPFYIFLEIYNNPIYKNMKKIVVTYPNKREWLENYLKFHNTTDVTIVEKHSREYCKALATAKYLVSNVTFPTYFMRKKEQVYWNTWHGTPLKALGRSIRNHPGNIGNVQRNFIHATHLSYANEYTFEHMRQDYMLEQLYQGDYILGGYPANDIFFSEKTEKEVREQLNLQGKKVVVYMPTWRDVLPNKKHNKQIYYIMQALYEMERLLDNDTVVLVKLHHLGESMIHFSDFTKIQAFPSEYETYEILNIANILITDYSSVMFDFLNKDRPIMLYTYDEQEYMNGRSMYFEIKNLPFFQTNNIYELCNQIIHTNGKQEYSSLKKMMCPYDQKNSTKLLCEAIILNENNSKVKTIPASKYFNHKKNVIIFAGTLMKNGITTAINSLLCNLDVDKYNYYIMFFQKAAEKNVDFVNQLDSKISYIPVFGNKNMKKREALCQYLYFRMNISNKIILKLLDHMFKTEAYRLFHDMKFDAGIHFSGYERKIIHLLPQCSKKVIINTHSDMTKEKKLRGNVHIPSMKYAYKRYNHIGVVNDTMKDTMTKYMKFIDANKIMPMHNLNDVEGIRMRANMPVVFDDDTECNVTKEELDRILKSDACKTINIARFSVEKRLDRLIDAFHKFQQEYPNHYLIIIGGHGNLYEDILKQANSLENIVIIKSLKNPMSILRQCDLFVLSSLYEGLPMTIMESLILNKPVISTEIPSVQRFFEDGYGYIVPNSTEGLYTGIKDFYCGKLQALKPFDAVKWNQQALQEFYDIIEK